MANGARGYQERDDQHQRIESEAEQPDEAEAPDGANHAGDRRPQRTAPIAEIKIEQDPDGEHRGDKDPEKFRRVVIHPSVQDRLSAIVDMHRRVALRRNDDLPNLVEDARVVESRLEEAALDHRRLVVERNEAAEDHAGIFVDVALEFFELAGGLGNVAVGQHGGIENHAAGQRTEIAGGRDRAHRAMLDAVNQLHVARHLDYFADDRGGVDRPLFRLDHDRNVVDAAEVLVVLVRDLDERMVLREQVAEAGNQLGLRREVAEEYGERADDAQHDEAPAQNPFTETIPDHCVLRIPRVRA